MARPSTTARCALVAAGIAVAGCSDGTSPQRAGAISISVATTTSGDLEPFNFQLVVDTLAPLVVSSSDASTFRVTGLRPGQHTVALQGLSTSCSSGSDSRQVAVVSGDTAVVDFQVECGPVTGELSITTTTHGQDIDPDGYVLLYDQTLVFELAQNQTRRLVHVPPGSHVIEVFDVEPNCVLGGSSSRDFVATAGVTGQMDLAIQCDAVPDGVPGFLASDPAGDTIPGTSGGTVQAIDLVQVSGRYAPGWIMLTLRFGAPVVAASLNAPNSLFGFIDFDVDENPSTGVGAGIDGFGGDAQQGVEYEISFLSNEDSTAEVYGLDGFLGLVHATYDADSVTFRLPLDKIGGDDGNLSYSVVVGTTDRPTDIAPSAGSLLARAPTSPMIARRGGSRFLANPLGRVAPRRAAPWARWRRWR